MGPWWFSQFDPVFEVSQAAKRSLQVCCLKNYHVLIVNFTWLVMGYCQND
jgi:hypothetical protein